MVSTTAFVFAKERHKDHKGDFVRLVNGRNEEEKANQFKDTIKDLSPGSIRHLQMILKKIPGNPISYWLSSK